MERHALQPAASHPHPHPHPPLQTSSPSGYQTLRKRKRERRTPTACESCRRRKAKCDGQTPCSPCQRIRVQCVYPEPRTTVAKSDAQLSGPVSSTRSAVGTELPCKDSGGDAHSSSRPQPSLVVHSACDTQEESSFTEGYHADEGQDTGSLQEVNQHTRGYEFYGATGVFPLLNKLRSRARSYHQQRNHQTPDANPAAPDQLGQTTSPKDPPTASSLETVSLVNYLYNTSDDTRSGRHNDVLDEASQEKSSYASPVLSSTTPNDECLVDQTTLAAAHGRSHPTINETTRPSLTISQALTPAAPPPHTPGDQRLEIEAYFIKTYFQNLHLISPLLDQSSFLSKCTVKKWQRPPVASSELGGSSSAPKGCNINHGDHDDRFEAVYYAVAALGAIVAPEDCLLSAGIGLASGLDEVPSHSPLTWAKIFFKKARANLGDVIQVCSLESTQALFLLSIFSQNALQPHNCYMYSGMAARTALAIGLPDERICRSDRQLRTASKTWWTIYSHEVEMCCSSGRDSLLRDRINYRIRCPSLIDGQDDNFLFITALTSLAEILSKASSSLYGPTSTLSISEKSAIATSLDETLLKWVTELPERYSFHGVSLKEPEAIGKRKTVLRLKYYNAQILIHRPFLEFANHESSLISSHVEACLDASRQTIDLLYNTYLNRSYFRTWWYNTTYTLNATIVVLYVVFQGFAIVPYHRLVLDVEKSLEILHAMDGVVVARNCAELIREVLNIARTALPQRFWHDHHAGVDVVTPRDQQRGAAQSSQQSPSRHPHVALQSPSAVTATGEAAPTVTATMPCSGSERAASAHSGSLPRLENLAPYFLPHDDLFALLFEQNLVESMNSPWQDQAENTAGGSYHFSGTQGHQLDFMPNIGASPDDEGQEWEVNCPANEGVLLSSETPGQGWDLV